MPLGILLECYVSESSFFASYCVIVQAMLLYATMSTAPAEAITLQPFLCKFEHLYGMYQEHVYAVKKSLKGAELGSIRFYVSTYVRVGRAARCGSWYQ